MTTTITESPDHSTTRCLNRLAPVRTAAPGARMARLASLPPHPQRKGEGGLRSRGLFKNPLSTAQHGAPLITVITVVFNGEKTLEQTILSVLSQNYAHVEYIIVDGGSRDGTVDILRKYEHALDYWVSEPDNGIFDAWNKSVALASGDWIAFLGADDVYLDGALAAYGAAIMRHDALPLDYLSSRVNLTRGDKVVRTIGQRWHWKAFGKYMNVAHVGSLHHRRLFDQYGGFDPAYRICGDYELLLRPRGALRADYFNTVTVNMSLGGVSDANWRALQEMTLAKINTGGRNRVLSWAEFSIAIVKWHIRRWIWY